MMRLFYAVLLLLCLAGVRSPGALAQSQRLLPPGDWTYTYIERLQRRGHLLALHPTALPYAEGEVRAALDALPVDALSATERRWADLLTRRLAPGQEERAVYGATFEAGLDALDSDRRDVLRAADLGTARLALGDVRLFPNGGVQGFLENGRFVADLGVRFDMYYQDDPDGLDAANRISSRSEGYLAYNGRFASAFLGRMENHWARPGDDALLVSDNPAPYDRLYLRLGGERFALRSLLGELDSITADGRYTGSAGADSVRGSERRYLAAHRFDWRPSRHVALSFMEANLFSGPSAGASLRFLNPLQLHVLLTDEPPKNDENNGLLAGMLWVHRRNVTLSGQLLVDDVDLLSETGEPASVALSGSLLYGGITETLDAGLRLTLVAARSYNTHQPEGRYLYLRRGLATAFSDYVEASAFADLYADAWLPGLIVTPEVTYLAQGERTFNEPYPHGDVPLILDGRVAHTTRVGARLFYQPAPRLWFRLDLGVNHLVHADHRAGVRATRFAGLAAFGLRLSTADFLPLP